ncbi:MAG: YbhB/YbcL family Raf kinase inhibitor-like protein [Luteimonas sp.]
MLAHLPSSIGHALRRVRPGLEKIVFHDPDIGTAISLSVCSNAFADGGLLAVRHTADGDKLSPPIEWHDVPAAARSTVVLVEDADSPPPKPLVHAIVWNLPGRDGNLAEGALSVEPSIDSAELGPNSCFQHAYLPPDPPPGHGPHRYAFQVFALDCVPDCDEAPGRGKLLDLLRGHVLASGLLVGTYERRRAS